MAPPRVRAVCRNYPSAELLGGGGGGVQGGAGGDLCTRHLRRHRHTHHTDTHIDTQKPTHLCTHTPTHIPTHLLYILYLQTLTHQTDTYPTPTPTDTHTHTHIQTIESTVKTPYCRLSVQTHVNGRSVDRNGRSVDRYRPTLTAGL